MKVDNFAYAQLTGNSHKHYHRSDLTGCMCSKFKPQIVNLQMGYCTKKNQTTDICVPALISE